MRVKHSVYPQENDGRSYFSNINIMNKKILSDHHTLMALKRYQEASEKLHESNVDYYSAELFNYLEECLYNLGARLKQKVLAIRPLYTEEIPVGEKQDSIWISSVEIQ